MPKWGSDREGEKDSGSPDEEDNSEEVNEILEDIGGAEDEDSVEEEEEEEDEEDDEYEYE